ncbi:hypothetical protein OESDEN_23274 [Oesophagostomum dentatum]|uniref:Uncharacterized protein n=1 Tax=Oesophagostomum dentatum TaxID=61180 RepID=A0A0B1RZN4_OESDE|nr:hypothetical protein OESDEN_23274 [Oesophagostomum dentatum]
MMRMPAISSSRNSLTNRSSLFHRLASSSQTSKGLVLVWASTCSTRRISNNQNLCCCFTMTSFPY